MATKTKDEQITALQAEVDRLTAMLNTPLYEEFTEAVQNESAHQVWRWGEDHDSKKTPEDWYQLVGFLAGKALNAHNLGNRTKALHHTISSSAVLLHWHAAIKRDLKKPIPSGVST